MNNIPKLIELKNALFSYAEKSANFIDLATSEAASGWMPITMQIDDDVSVSVSDSGVVTAVNTTTGATVERLATEMAAEFTQNASDAVSVSMSTMAQAQSDAMNSFTSLAAVTELFITRATISANDVRNTIIDSTTEMTPDVNRILGAVAQVADVKGNISSQAWISLSTALLKDSGDSAEQSFVLDKTKPFALRSLLQIALDHIGDIISTIMGAIATALHGLAGIVVATVTSIFNALRSANDQTIEIVDESNTDYVKGPITYGEKVPTRGLFAMATLDTNAANYFRCPVGDFFCWVDGSVTRGGQTYATVSLQGFLRPTFSVERVRSYVSSPSQADITTEVGKLIKVSNNYPAQSRFSELYLTDAEAIVVNSDPALALKTLVVDQLFRDWLHIRAGSYLKNYNTAKSIHKTDASWITRMLNAFEFAYVARNDSKFNSWIGSSTTQLEVLQRMYIDIWSVVAPNPFTGSIPLKSLETLNDPNSPDLKGSFYPNPFQEFFGESVTEEGAAGYGCSPAYRDFVYTDVTYIPNNPRFIIPGWANAAIFRALGVVLASVAAVFAVKTVTSKLLAKRTAARQLSEVGKLNALKRAYDADPTKENSDNLYKATRKYNRRARLFGWGQYDSVNAWLNPPSVSTADVAVSSATSSLTLDSVLTADNISKTIGKLENGEPISSALDTLLAHDSDASQLDSKLDQITTLITGVPQV